MTAMLAEFFASPEALAAASQHGSALPGARHRDHPARAGARRVRAPHRRAARRGLVSARPPAAIVSGQVFRGRDLSPAEINRQFLQITFSGFGSGGRYEEVGSGVMATQHVVVIGGSVAGLGVALALSGRGHRVTVLEADATPLPASHLEAFARWDRRGSPQTRHSHALLARLRNLIRDHAPELLEKLLVCGAEELRFTDRVHQLFPDAALAARRRGHRLPRLPAHHLRVGAAAPRARTPGRVDFRDGVEVTRLEASATRRRVCRA